MPRLIYLPLFDSFFESSLMGEAVETRFLFLVMLRLANRPGADGVVDVPLARLAALAAMSGKSVRRALAALTRPDPESGSQDEDGRRLVPLDPKRPDRGWRVVNFVGYQERLRQTHDAARKRRERGRGESSPHVGADLGRPPTESVRKCPDVSGSGDTKTKTKTKTKKRGAGSVRGARAPLAPLLPDVLTFARESGISEKSATAYFQHRSEKGWRGIADFRPGLTKWAAEDAEKEASKSPPRPRVASLADLEPNTLGIRPAKDGSSMNFRGEWYQRHPDGKRWLAEGYRPDGTPISASEKDSTLNAKVWSAMNAVIAGTG